MADISFLKELGTLINEGNNFYEFHGTEDKVHEATTKLMEMGFSCDNGAFGMGFPEVYGYLMICNYDSPGFMICAESKEQSKSLLINGFENFILDSTDPDETRQAQDVLTQLKEM